jgi:hypothetical protein
LWVAKRVSAVTTAFWTKELAMSPHPTAQQHPQAPERRGYWVEERRPRSGFPTLAVVGLSLLGLGLLGWMYFGPDLKRYMRIREM